MNFLSTGFKGKNNWWMYLIMIAVVFTGMIIGQIPITVVALAEVNAEIKKLENDPVPPVTDPAHLADDPAESNVSAPSVADSDVDSPAQGLLLQAELMEQDAEAMLAEAKEKKRQAFEMDPSLKPKRGPGRPPKEDI